MSFGRYSAPEVLRGSEVGHFLRVPERPRLSLGQADDLALTERESCPSDQVLTQESRLESRRTIEDLAGVPEKSEMPALEIEPLLWTAQPIERVTRDLG